MRNMLWIISGLVLAMVTSGVQAQTMPRSRGDRGRFSTARPDNERSPSMSRVATSSRTTDKQSPRGATPVKRDPVVKHLPIVTRQADLRPGVGSVPSGKKSADRGKLRDFVPPPGSHDRTVARPTVVTTRRPTVVTTRRPTVVTTRRPTVVTPLRRPSIYHAPVTVARKPSVYRPAWGRTTPFTATWYKTRVVQLPPRRSRHYYPWLYNQSGHGASHWWTRAAMATLAKWMHHRWTRPVYYVYGLDGNVYYQGNMVYVDGVRYSTADNYYRQARAIALAVPNLDDAAAARLEWRPLGVFAITRQGLNQTQQSCIQLAVTREGLIGGTYFNEATGTSRPIEGSVDQATQRVAWTFADGRNTDFVVESSFYNLTQDQVPVLVHFGPERVQEGLLVRVEAPAQ